MKRDYRLYLDDILEAIEKIGEWKECPLTNLLKTQRLYAVKEF